MEQDYFLSKNNNRNKLSELITINNLSVRATNVLLQNVKSIEELLSLQKKNFGRSSLNELQYIISSICLKKSSNSSDAKQIDYSSYENSNVLILINYTYYLKRNLK